MSLFFFYHITTCPRVGVAYSMVGSVMVAKSLFLVFWGILSYRQDFGTLSATFGTSLAAPFTILVALSAISLMQKSQEFD